MPDGMREPHRRIRRKLDAGQRAFGITISLPSAEAAEIAGYAGADFVWVDAEHGTLDLGDIGRIVRAADAAGIDAIVRVPDHVASYIQRVLDTGAAGIIAPHVRTVAEARALVASAKFAPAGVRGACPATRAVGHLTFDWPVVSRRANDDVLVFGLIEDLEGVENVEAIASESGLDGLVFGPFDLAQALGHGGDLEHAEIERMHRQVTEAVRASGVEYIALPGWERTDYAAMVEYCRIFMASSDRGALFTSFQTGVADLSDALERAAAGAPA
jgi:4-hydroxy-2-oxoheptanedioate aldolase